MLAFYSMLKTALRQRLQYRTAAIAGLFTQLVFGMIYCMVYQAFYASNPNAYMEMTLTQVISYTWIAQSVFRMLPWGGDHEIEQLMRTGDIAFELARPAGLYKLWFARCLALRIAPFLLNCLPGLLITSFLLPADLRAHIPLHTLPLGLVALALATVLSTTMTLLFTQTYFWTMSGYGINRILPVLAMFCAGLNIPLFFLPEVITKALRVLPFAGMLDAPLRILVGTASGAQALELMALQIFWIVALLLAGNVLMLAGVRKCRVQGG